MSGTMEPPHPNLGWRSCSREKRWRGLGRWKETQTYPLRLPRSLKEAVERLSQEDRTSINQFVATAVAEKVSALSDREILRGPAGAGGFPGFRQDHETEGRKGASQRRRNAGVAPRGSPTLSINSGVLC